MYRKHSSEAREVVEITLIPEQKKKKERNV